MNKWVRRGAITLTVMVAGASAAFLTLAELGERKLQRRVEVAVAPVTMASDAASIDRGRYLFASRGCAGCHGDKGQGGIVVDEGGMFVRAPDITASPQGVAAHYSDGELAALHGRILASITPAEHVVVARWMIPASTPAERARIVAGMKSQMPPEALLGLMAVVIPHLDNAGWVKLAAAAGIDPQLGRS